MNIFQLAFCKIMRNAEINRRDFQQISGVQPPTISRYFNGQSVPRPSVLEKIIKVLKPDQSRELLDAYLQAQFPSLDYAKVLAGKARPERAALLKKKKATGKKGASNVQKAIQAAEKEDVEKTINVLRELALRNKSIAHTLESLALSLKA